MRTYRTQTIKNFYNSALSLEDFKPEKRNFSHLNMLHYITNYITLYIYSGLSLSRTYTGPRNLVQSFEKERV